MSVGGDGEWGMRDGMGGDHGDGGLETASIGEVVCVGIHRTLHRTRLG